MKRPRRTIKKRHHNLNSLEKGIRIFTNEFVSNPAYTPKWPKEAKIIHDALWGTIRLDPWEIALLDLPLIQRLRQIRQTSLVHYVFPGCNHTRFDHTLGVLLHTQRLAEAVNKQDEKPSDPPFDHDVIRDLRLAAIFHDCGHGCFSHISEAVYRLCPDINAAIKVGGEYEKCTPHEVFSTLILKSLAVRNYVSKLSSHYNVEFNIDRAAKWILGKTAPGESKSLYRAQVINGPFDADKLDYIFRDAHFSGLPLSLDLHRLWASCQTMEESKLGKRILTLHQACAAPLEQILFSKLNLFSIVYQHPKVRAAECMFQGVIELIRNSNIEIDKKNLKKATDFLWITDDRFFAEALKRKKSDLLHQMIHNILYRRLLVRALTISMDTVTKTGKRYHELRQLNQKTKQVYDLRRALARKIWIKAGKPHSPYEIWVDLPPEPPIGSADQTYVRTPSGLPRKLSDLFPIHYWSLLYISHKWRGHVFCPHDCQQEIYEAAKKVLKSEYGLTFKKSAGELSHVPNP